VADSHLILPPEYKAGFIAKFFGAYPKLRLSRERKKKDYAVMANRLRRLIQNTRSKVVSSGRFRFR
jgi:hypothetical protein